MRHSGDVTAGTVIEALGDPVRRQVVTLLSGGPRRAGEIAADLTQDLDVQGIFMCAGARPSKEEIAAAQTRRQDWYQQLVSEADTMWARGHSYREISDMHRRAALSLGIEREWAFVPQKMIECPACGENLKPHVAVCKHCGAVLDAEKAAKHGLGAAAKSRS